MHRLVSPITVNKYYNIESSPRAHIAYLGHSLLGTSFGKEQTSYYNLAERSKHFGYSNKQRHKHMEITTFVY